MNICNARRGNVQPSRRGAAKWLRLCLQATWLALLAPAGYWCSSDAAIVLIFNAAAEKIGCRRGRRTLSKRVKEEFNIGNKYFKTVFGYENAAKTRRRKEVTAKGTSNPRKLVSCVTCSYRRETHPPVFLGFSKTIWSGGRSIWKRPWPAATAVAAPTRRARRRRTPPRPRTTAKRTDQETAAARPQ